MLDPRRNSATLAVGVGIVVLVLALVAGMHTGDQTMKHAVAGAPVKIAPAAVIVTPATHQEPGAYGPRWTNTQVMAAPTDPGFPDPRVPPRPLPVLAPIARPVARPSYNPNIPIWRQEPLPTLAPTVAPTVKPTQPSAPVSAPPRE